MYIYLVLAICICE